MSYSFNPKCWKCENYSKCVDPFIIAGAINAIHTIGYEKGHLGGGSIDLNCQNFVEKAESGTEVLP